MNTDLPEAAERRWTDRDQCSENHRFDDDCNWRSQDERDAHLLVTLALHREVEDCPHRGYGGQCEVLATVALDALYENGWRPARG